MLDTIKTWSVDIANNDTLVAEDFERIDQTGDRSIYHGPDHTLEKRDKLEIQRALPKPNGKFKGTSKPSVKLTEDVVVPSSDPDVNLSAVLIAQLGFAIPVGTPGASVVRLRQRIAAIADDDAFWDKILDGHV